MTTYKDRFEEPPEKGTYLTVKEAARRLGIGVERVYRLLWSGKIESYRESVGRRRYLIPEKAVVDRAEFKKNWVQWDEPKAVACPNCGSLDTTDPGCSGGFLRCNECGQSFTEGVDAPTVEGPREGA